MNGKALIVALSIVAMATTAADAATKKKKNADPPVDPTAQVTEPPPSAADSRTPAYYECWTDEGYGRRTPCGYSGK